MNDTTLVGCMHADVARFNAEVIGLPIPDAPQMLSPQRKTFAVDHLGEELDEFAEAVGADDVAKAADALVDLVYVALGRLVEMGISPGAAFTEVHDANMRKVRGEVAKRPNSLGHDAVKPEGWTPPDLMKILQVTHADVEWLADQKEVAEDYTANADAYDEAMRDGGEDVVVTQTKMIPEPDWLPYLSPVFVEVARLRMAKGKDYNNGPQLKDYFPFGHYSYAQMCHVKNLRIHSLLAVMMNGGKPNFEGLRDTLLDNINYNCFYVEAVDAGTV